MADDRALAAELMSEYAESSPYHGVLPEPTFSVEGGNPACGDKISMTVKLEDGIVKHTKFLAQGCLISRAAAGLMGELVENKSIEQILALGIKELEQGLGTDFRSRVKCALLPLYVLQEGLKQYQQKPVPGAALHVSAPRNLGI